jgi:leader peptidase (prepilin peptidase) / N-methyltransferase
LALAHQGTAVLTSFIEMPLWLRVLIILLVSILIARLTNWAIYSWAHFSRSLGPWSIPPQFGQRTWLDHLPIIGWYFLRRESDQHGKGYWIRPLLLELILPLTTIWYYKFLISGGTLPAPVAMLSKTIQPELHNQFLGHFVLYYLMAIATFIDFDERSIPDAVTIPGTMIGLLGAAFMPGWLGMSCPWGPPVPPVEMQALEPEPWWLELNGRLGLWAAMATLLVWTFGLLDRRIILRRGWKKAVQFFFAGMFRDPFLWKIVFASGAVMLAGVAIAWNAQIVRWPYLLSSVLGLACAAGVTWAVRVTASWTLGVEALGFGDVTLMAMIGTFAGWQPSIIIFFLAPVMAVLIVLIQFLVTRDPATPFGPYLCAAAVVMFLFWDRIWNGWGVGLFALGWWILIIMAVCIVIMGAMLWIWRLLKQAALGL